MLWFYVKLSWYQVLCTIIVNTQIRHIEIGSCFNNVIWIDDVTICVVKQPDFFPCNCGEKSNLGGKSNTFTETKNNETMLILSLYEHIFRRRDISILGLYFSFLLLLRKQILNSSLVVFWWFVWSFDKCESCQLGLYC